MMPLVGKKMCTFALCIFSTLNISAEGEPKMPMLNWMGRENVTNVIKDVAMKILREDKSLGATTGFCLVVLKLLKFKHGLWICAPSICHVRTWRKTERRKICMV